MIFMKLDNMGLKFKGRVKNQEKQDTFEEQK